MKFTCKGSKILSQHIVQLKLLLRFNTGHFVSDFSFFHFLHNNEPFYEWEKSNNEFESFQSLQLRNTTNNFKTK